MPHHTTPIPPHTARKHHHYTPMAEPAQPQPLPEPLPEPTQPEPPPLVLPHGDHWMPAFQRLYPMLECVRCSLRMAGVWYRDVFLASEKRLRAAMLPVLGEFSLDLEKPIGGVCFLCLGMLQDADVEQDTPLMSKEVEAIVNQIKKKGYVLPEAAEPGNATTTNSDKKLGFILGLTLPASLAIRDQAALDWLETVVNIFDRRSSGRIEVKDILKFAIERHLQQHLPCLVPAPSPPAPGTLNLDLSFWKQGVDAEDYQYVCSIMPRNYLDRKAYRRTRKRKKHAGSNMENLCTSTVVSQVIGAAMGDRDVKEQLAGWFDDLRENNFEYSEELRGGIKDAAVPALATVDVTREAIYLKGRYLKYSREMPQTLWLLDGGVRKGKASVEEVISEPVKEWSGSENLVLMGSGREDMDVRMLGNGRPFLLQVNDPRRVPTEEGGEEEVAALQAAINAKTGLNSDGDVCVRELRLSDRRQVKIMHAGAAEKQKLYACRVWVGGRVGGEVLREGLETKRELVVQQTTPIRVLHRRALLTRPKIIHEMRCEDIKGVEEEGEEGRREGKEGGKEDEGMTEEGVEKAPGTYFTLHLRTAAGTYIKEFVHGDMGRTRPSVGSLIGGLEADLLALDVTGVVVEEEGEEEEVEEEEEEEDYCGSGEEDVELTWDA